MQIGFNWDMAQRENIRAILAERGCGEKGDVLTDKDVEISPHFVECISILSLEALSNNGILLKERRRKRKRK